MSTIQIVSLLVVCIAFIVFAVALAWGDYQTRNISHNRLAQPERPLPAKLQLLKTEAAASEASARSTQTASAK
ncbi:MAG: hypothetical protein WAL80_18350 [Xanthobacteraceae bacterium]|jgi:cell division protein FtsL